MTKQLIKLSAAITFLIIVQFSNVIAQQPRTPKQWFELGKIQNDQKQYSQAVKAFSECIRLDKTAFTCFINRGVAYRNLKKQTEAISDYSAAIRLNPKSVDAYNNRGVSNGELKKYSEAKSDFTKALEIEPNNKAATDNLAKLEKITDVNYFGDLGDIDWDSYILKKVCLSGNCVNGKGKSDDYRGIYEGDFVDNKFNGQGKATYSNGETYEGQWFQDFKMLEGKATFPNGDSYNGNYAFGKFQFQGTYTYKNGNYYVGEWKNGKQNGFGKEFTKATNKTQEGTWKDGVLANATKDGSLIDSLKEEFKETCVSGNCVNGKGKKVDGFGNIYEGDFVNGKFEGQGTYTAKVGFVFVGQLANDKFNGKGKMKLLFNGNSYEGDFVNGKFEGQGTYTYKNGNYYIGEWKNNKQNGYGKFYNKATNTTQEGTWKDGVFVGKQ